MIIGITTTELSDGATTNPIQINGEDYTAVTGDVVVYGSPVSGEYYFNGVSWDLIGTGGSDSPFIVLSWEDFLRVRPSSLATDTYIKFGNLNMENGDFMGSGSGTTDNPFICNTFEEICVALGCHKIWQADIYDDCEDTDKMKVYHYNGHYAKHMRTPTTIDLEEYFVEGTETTLNLYGIINFNGWTLTNIRAIDTDSFVKIYKTSGLILTNFVFEYNGGTSGSRMILARGVKAISDSMLQCSLSTSGQYTYIVPYTTGGGAVIERVAMDILGSITTQFILAESSTTEAAIAKFYDCVINESINGATPPGTTSNSRGNFYNTKLTGSIKYDTTSTSFTDTKKFTNCIVDVLHKNANNELMDITLSKTCVNSIYNTDKVGTFTATGFAPLTTSNLESASDIAATGFPIGVD